VFFRNVLFILGAVLIAAGIALGYFWITGQEAPAEAGRADAPPPQAAAQRIFVLSAAHRIPAETLLQPADISWKEIGASDLRPGNLVRGQISEADFLGAMTTREFAEQDVLNASDLLKLSDRRFLAAVLKRGSRAISVSVDAAQSASGLLLPGNHVDVILTQNITDPSWEGRRKIVAETFLRDIRVIAVDQSLNQQPKTPADSPILAEPRVPKTVTLELTQKEAEMVFVALQLGSIQLSLRPLDGRSGTEGEGPASAPPTWAFDVSPALRETMRKPPAAVQSGSPLEALIRRPPAS
jgi:pilus assembly protein CpaB